MSQPRLGTFIGVFTPTILTILGVIMYMRFGWLVGHLGLIKVLMIVTLANTITLLTTLSFSSIATNARVGVGGAYFMVSRSLGLELGGAIGVPLFLSQAFSVTLYAYGLAESMRIVAPGLPLTPVTLGVVAAVGLLALAGADKALRAQVVLMALVALSIVALAIGGFTNSGSGTPLDYTGTGELPFWSGFAIFFPAVTGIMAGLGLSGDLKDPGKSIPTGAILAVVAGFVVYLIIPVFLLLGATAENLRDDTMVWSRIAPLGPILILPGLWAAIFSSAVGSILAAPRTLQALARDGIAPAFLGKVTGDWKELLPGVLVSMIIALAAVFLGNLNAVAAVVSMFFLTVYGTMNLAAAFEALSGDPSWRPRLRTHWSLNLIGGIGCFVVMMLISPLAGIVALVLEFALWMYLSRRAQQARWGDARRGLYESLIRWALLRLSDRPLTPRNWRPHVLVFIDDARSELDLVRFGDWFSQGRGVVTVAHLELGDLDEHDPEVPAMVQSMRSVMDEHGLVVFTEVDVVHDIVDGIVDVSQANGMAGMTSNTIILGWPADRSLRVELLRSVRKLENLHKSVLFGRIDPMYAEESVSFQRIVVWWGGLERNSDLMLLLAHLLRCNTEWRDAEVEVISIASNELMRARTEQYLANLMPDIRIRASVRVILKPKDVSVTDIIHRESDGADAVFFGLATPPVGEEASYADRLEKLAGDLPAVFFVKNASMFIGELLESPEEEFDTAHKPDSGVTGGDSGEGG